MSLAWSMGLLSAFISTSSIARSSSAQDLIDPKRPNSSQSNSSTARFHPQGATRFVVNTEANLYPAPTTESYSTATLEKGEPVEVYIETEDGWSGIRPPKGSFSLIASDTAYLLPGGKSAQIGNQPTPAWIGTNASKQNANQLKWQIELQPSQEVNVLGEIKQQLESGTTRLWYKIQPPPGEFRWIRTEQIGHAPVPASTLLENQTATKLADEQTDQVVSAAYQTTTRMRSLISQNSPEEVSGNRVVGPAPNLQPPGVSTQVWDENEIVVGEYFDDESEYMVWEENDEVWYEDGIECEDCQNHPEAHQVDSFFHWNRLQSPIHSNLKIRPLSKILGLIGLAVVEADRVEECDAGCNCQSCRSSFHGHLAPQPPRYSDRFQHLPRPGTRLPTMGRPLGGLLSEMPFSPNPRTLESYADVPSSGSNGLQASFASAPLTSGIHSPSLLATTPLQSTSDPYSLEQQSKELQFSTPQIRNAMAELSRTVAQPIDMWDLYGQAYRAQDWIDSATDPLVRGEARLLLERIEEFEILRRRHRSNPTQIATTQIPSLPVEPNTTSNTPIQLAGYQTHSPLPPQTNPDGTPLSDASGWLVQVHSQIAGYPPYALTDDSGNVIAYVQPSPGMNLSRFVKQPVGIYGVKGYLPNLAAKQIIAERIVRLR